ncbi:hypothetical protein GHK92_18030 [Nocardioides sp. dk4132]|uniref:hypothetical protein n=1 Tax=unclassified Nocardioides TaxID=2615069 RepID=UPI001297AD3D|nr:MULTISPECIES: hypothetical protein [unclassified Nocardioides]MQW77774.1 hypothetical protein [Nocardioides sp. dk4132]QGA07042.1 hypothetical protein GFH29_06340 [Nocardioides sp. dk884]
MMLLVLALAGTAVLLTVGPAAEDAEPVAVSAADPTASATPATPGIPDATPAAVAPARATLPHGGRAVFEGNRFLVAYYGTAGTGALGVLGEDRPALMHRRLVAAAAPFARPGQPVQPVYELIVTIADAAPGPDGDYHHDLDRRAVQRYIDAAHRHGALVLLDLQPGHADFLTVARRWAWALRDPYVGLALDPEWRMPGGEVPGRVIGHVRAAEVNRTSAWLARLVARHDLPQKLFVLHQFRGSMLPDLERVRARRGLVMVQHADGFGTRGEKLAGYRAIARPRQFTMGWKLFYDEDVDRMGAAAVHRVRPRVRFVSFQ